MSQKAIPVRVVVRCRPLVEKETNDGCCECLEFVNGEPQITIGQQKTFTYDYVFDTKSSQADVYTAVKPLIRGLFKGYNATVLAYGQTGSGKTFTMGGGGYDSDEGIIPRVISELYNGIVDRSDDTFETKVSYLEIYKEELIDLLVEPSKREKDAVSVREDIQGGIKLVGLQEKSIEDRAAMFSCLELGSQGRTTGATAMNARSSRSHAIFTIHINRISKSDPNKNFKAKFHLVDLAGSERAKKTKASGDRFREGVNINMGLLALGNVISALGDEVNKRSHIPYRDSKLTRILQDSLGGNSHTVMIACVSPADYNMEETLTTLRYADRARKIKNKPIINRDPHAAEICKLKAVIQQLQSQLVGGDSNATTTSTDTCSTITDNKLTDELCSLREYTRKLEEESQRLTTELQASLEQNTKLCEKVILCEMERDNMKEKLSKLKTQACETESLLNATEDLKNNSQVQEQLKMMQSIQESIVDMENDDTEVLKSLLQEQVNSTDPVTPVSSPTCVSAMVDNDNTLGDGHGDVHGDVHAKKHVMKQAKMARELEELNTLLEKKQQLAQQMNANDQTISMMKMEYEQNTKDLENEVHQLHKEKDELLSQLNAKKETNTKKLSEQRRQRLEELETKISALTRKMSEQNKMLKMKESTDKQLERVNNEIKAMKVQRVKLMKSMKEDGENFRKWKQQKDKELIQLKAKDLKRQGEMKKLERQHEHTRAVLKRKADEALAVNKRLKDALSRQKDAAADRMRKQDRHELSVKDRIQKWLKEELDVLVSVKEAKSHLESLMADRKVLAKQLSTLNKQQEFNDDSQDASVIELRQEVNIVEAEIQLRNVQISDIQQKLVDADQEEKNKLRWNNIHTMGDAKCALRSLLNMAVSAKVDASSHRSDSTEAKILRVEAMKTLEQADEKLKKYKEKTEDDVLTLRKEYESKILYLLTELKKAPLSSTDSPADHGRVNERMAFLQKEVDRMAKSQERLSRTEHEAQKQAKEVEALKKELTIAKYKGRNVSLMPDVGAPLEDSPFIGGVVKKKRQHKPRLFSDFSADDDDIGLLDDVSGDEEYEDDQDEDPDWQKGFTPGIPARMKRRQTEAPVSRLFPSDQDSGTDTEGNPEQVTSPQRTFDPKTSTTCCTCKGACANSRCRCVKVRLGCSDGCACMPSRCKNNRGARKDGSQTGHENGVESADMRKDDVESSMVNSTVSSTMNTTFDVSSNSNNNMADTTFLVGNSSNNSSNQSSQNTTQETLSTSRKRSSRGLDDDAVADENSYKRKTKTRRLNKQKSLFPKPNSDNEGAAGKYATRGLLRNSKFFSELNV